METNYRISPFVELGRRLARQLAGGELDAVVARAIAENGWFTRQSVAQAIEAICTDLLDETVLRDWLARYPRPDASAVRRVGIVLAGNIPLVGFFDLLCVCICGHRCFVKPSSKDRVLTGYVVEQLLRIEPAMPVAPLEEDTPLDALIATGSDSTRSYFGKRYREMPSLLRGSRYSIAVLDGTETEAQLEGLSNDVFQYFGLGCRNVGRIFVPRGYDPTLLRDALSRYPMSHPGYLNNYRQARALRMLDGEPLLDGGFSCSARATSRVRTSARSGMRITMIWTEWSPGYGGTTTGCSASFPKSWATRAGSVSAGRSILRLRIIPTGRM